MKMTSGCLVSFHKHFGSKYYQIFHRKFIPSFNTVGPRQFIRLHNCTQPLRCLDTVSAVKIGCVRWIHSSSSLEAGHSKWQNIKHIKAAHDRERGLKSSLLSRKLQLIFAKNPETDPKLNTELANIIKWARSNNLTNDVINNAIDRQIKLKDPNCITAFGGRGPSNTGIIVECYSLRPLHTKGMIQSVVKRFGFNLHNPVEDLFEHKGIVDVELSGEELTSAQSDPDNFRLDKYVDMAINAGAEDVTLEYDGEKPYLQFLCAPLDLNKVFKGLNEAGLNIVSNEKTYIPKLVVPVSEEFLETLNKLTAKLDLNTEVIKYHFNVEPEH